MMMKDCVVVGVVENEQSHNLKCLTTERQPHQLLDTQTHQEMLRLVNQRPTGTLPE